MLVSHRKKFIFVKTGKTAGTSVEVFFEKYWNAGVKSCILHIFFFKLWLFYSYLV
jgi:hypothetical protein